MRKVVFTILAVALSLVAYVEAAFACGPWGYQPNMPEKLKM